MMEIATRRQVVERLTGHASCLATGYNMTEGHAVQITLPDGKYCYRGVGSIWAEVAKKRGWKCEVVDFYGACIYANIADRAHEGLPIEINGIKVSTFLDKIAKYEEELEFWK